MAQVYMYFLVFMGCGYWCLLTAQTTPPMLTPTQGSTMTTTPDMVTGLTVSPESSNQLAVTWTASARADDYNVSYILIDLYQCGDSNPTQPRLSAITVTETTTILDELQPNSLYEVYVTANNMFGSSDEVSARNSTEGGPIPTSGVPIGVSSTDATATSLDFKWTEVICGQAHGPITSYNYTLTAQSLRISISDIVKDTKVSIPNLDSCETYSFQVAVVREDGTEGDSAEIMATTAPGMVTNLVVLAASSTSLTVLWSLPPARKCVTKYSIMYSLVNIGGCLLQTEDYQIILSQSQSGIVTIMNLLPYSTYKVKVRAETGTEGLVGSYSTPEEQTTNEAAPAAPPTNITEGEPTSTSLTYSWDPLSCLDRNGIIQYRLKLTKVGDSEAMSVRETTSDTDFTFAGLIPFTRYTFTVTAETGGGKGDVSEPIQSETSKDVPSRPLIGLAPGEATTTSVTIKWSPPTQPNGKLLKYLIQSQVIESPFDKTFSLSKSDFLQNKTIEHKNNVNEFSQIIEKLDHGSTIKVWIRVQNDAPVGKDIGQPAEMVLSTDIKDPDITFPSINVEEREDNLFAISLSSPIVYPNVSKILIIVNKNSNEKINTSLLAADYKTSTTSYYIVGVFESLPSNFTIGDNVTYNGLYINAPLDEGVIKDATVHIGYIFNIQPRIRQGELTELFTFVSSGTPLLIEVVADTLAGVIIGIVIAVILVLLMLIIIVWKTGLLKRVKSGVKRRNSEEDNRIDLRPQNPSLTGRPSFHEDLKLALKIKRVSAPQIQLYEQFKIGEEIYQVPKQSAPVKRKPPSAATLARGRGPFVPTLPQRQKRGMVPWSHFHVLEKRLGKGAFGEVYLGYVWSDRLDEWQQAAIKILKPNAPSEEEAAFNGEFKMMQKLEFNKNVISLLAASTNDENILHVGIEFAPHGNLRRFLRRYRKARARGRTLQQGIAAAGDADDIPELTLQQLLLFAVEVIEGMLHLVKKKVIHRDLAARNVLLGDEDGKLVAKVADFGLARENVYQRSNNRTRLATRWQAIESLSKGQYSHQSDVWGFGVLLWEIVTLGSTPYEKFERRDIIHFLDQGKRMPKPEGCTQRIYDLMLRCWQETPDTRPTFAGLKKQVTRIMNQDDGDTPLYANWNLDTQIVEARDDD